MNRGFLEFVEIVEIVERNFSTLTANTKKN